MLSSRYLHLHEALGLGPMWLKQGAAVHTVKTAARPSEPPPQTEHSGAFERTPSAEAAPQTLAAPPVQTAPAAHETPRPTRSKPVVSAHAEAMAMVGSSVGAFRKNRNDRPSGTAAGDGLPKENRQQPAAPAAQNNGALPREHYLAEWRGKIQAAKLMVVSVCPSPEDLAAGKLFSQKDGELLDNMLAAIGLRAEDACRLSWLETVEFTPSTEHIMQTAPRLNAAVEIVRPRAVLLLGQFFERHDLNDAVDAAFGSLPSFTVQHPARLLRQPQWKADAWQTLKCLRPLLAD